MKKTLTETLGGLAMGALILKIILQQTELETRLLRAMKRAILDVELSRDGKGTSALPRIRATIAKLTAEYERLTGKTPTFRRNKGTVILGEGRPKADAGTA